MPDFASLLELSMNPLEPVVRGRLMYRFLFLLLLMLVPTRRRTPWQAATKP